MSFNPDWQYSVCIDLPVPSLDNVPLTASRHSTHDSAEQWRLTTDEATPGHQELLYTCLLRPQTMPSTGGCWCPCAKPCLHVNVCEYVCDNVLFVFSVFSLALHEVSIALGGPPSATTDLTWDTAATIQSSHVLSWYARTIEDTGGLFITIYRKRRGEKRECNLLYWMGRVDNVAGRRNGKWQIRKWF